MLRLRYSVHYETSYKNFKLGVRKTSHGWKPEVINSDTGESYSDLHDGQIVPYAPYLEAGEAQEKAYREATRLADGIEQSCENTEVEWKLIQTDTPPK